MLVRLLLVVIAIVLLRMLLIRILRLYHGSRTPAGGGDVLGGHPDAKKPRFEYTREDIVDASYTEIPPEESAAEEAEKRDTDTR